MKQCDMESHWEQQQSQLKNADTVKTTEYNRRRILRHKRTAADTFDTVKEEIIQYHQWLTRLCPQTILVVTSVMHHFHYPRQVHTSATSATKHTLCISYNKLSIANAAHNLTILTITFTYMYMLSRFCNIVCFATVSMQNSGSPHTIPCMTLCNTNQFSTLNSVCGRGCWYLTLVYSVCYLSPTTTKMCS